MSHKSTPWLLGVIAVLILIITVLGWTGPHRQAPAPTPTPPPAVAQDQATTISVQTGCAGLLAIGCGNVEINTNQTQEAQPAQPAPVAAAGERQQSSTELWICALLIIFAATAICMLAAHPQF